MFQLNTLHYIVSKAYYDKAYLTKIQLMLIGYGYKKSLTPEQLYYNLKNFVKDYKEIAIAELGRIHPDKELVIEANKVLPPHIEKNIKTNKIKQFSASPNNPFQKYSQATGNYFNPNVSFKEYLPAIVISTVALGLLAFVVSRIK